jgi:hypothetical protein
MFVRVQRGLAAAQAIDDASRLGLQAISDVLLDKPAVAHKLAEAKRSTPRD